MEFSDIALAKFLQTAPELGPLIVNFTEVTEQLDDQQGGVKVGVFSLKAGPGLVTVPVIMRGDTVFPIDSVYVEQEELFRPLSTSTINYLIGLNSAVTGKSTKIPSNVDKNPNLYNLINPPRTGKFVYASSSRLVEFLAALPAAQKNFVFEKIAGEQSLYDSLDKLFGLKAIFSVLNGNSGGSGPVNTVATGPEPLRLNNLSVITSPGEVRALGNEALAKAFLHQGYVVTGDADSFRTAVAYQPYNQIGTYHIVNPCVDSGRDHMIVMRDGSSKEAFLPKYHRMNPISGVETLVSIFSDGNYARGSLVSAGDAINSGNALDELFQLRPPKLLRELERDEHFLVFTNSGTALGPFNARSVTRTATGVEVKVYAGNVRRICGYQNFTKEVDIMHDTLYLPSNVLVLSLGEDLSDSVERSTVMASDKKELVTTQYLGAQLDIRYDGVEFQADSKPLGKFASAMKYLVEQEHIEPDTAKNFLKQAEEIKFLKIFLSKKASSTDYAPAEMPQYGAVAPRTEDIGLNGSFLPSVQNSMGLGDPQAVESTIISQLLQVPDMFEYIGEYLPELESTADRLGRILFLTRAKLDQISNSLDSDSVFSLISQIKTVYKQLGDTTLKLKGIAASSSGFNKEETVGTPTSDL